MILFRFRPSITSVILSSLIVSCALRIATTGMAYAQETDFPIPVKAETMGDKLPMASQKCSEIEDADAFIQALREREENLIEQELEFQLRAQDLQVSERLVRDQIAKLEAVEEKLSQTLALADEAAENDIGQLTDVYEKMKPKSAAQIFEGMDPRFASGFLMAMRPESAAAIMSNLSSEKAYSVSVLMAARNARAPSE